MERKDVVMSRVDKLKEYLNYLKDVSNYSKNEYISTPMIYGSTERFLQLAIECAIDIGNHIISDLGLRKPQSSKEIFEILYENNIIGENAKENLCKMAQFRNILVHDYIRLNREIVYNIVLNNLGDLQEFIKAVINFI